MSVVKQAAKAYHVERLAFRVLKYTARARAQYFLRVFAPEITEEASRIVDEAVRSAEVALLGWTAEEVEKAQGQACLAFEFGGHDMQPRTNDRYLLHLAAWLESMEDDDSAVAPAGVTAPGGGKKARCNFGPLITHWTAGGRSQLDVNSDAVDDHAADDS